MSASLSCKRSCRVDQPRSGRSACTLSSISTRGGLRRLWRGRSFPWGETSAHPLRQDPRQVAYAAQLELLDGTRAATQHIGGLGDRETLQEPHHQAVPLLGGELAQGLEQRLVGE